MQWPQYVTHTPEAHAQVGTPDIIQNANTDALERWMRQSDAVRTCIDKCVVPLYAIDKCEWTLGFRSNICCPVPLLMRNTRIIVGSGGMWGSDVGMIWLGCWSRRWFHKWHFAFRKQRVAHVSVWRIIWKAHYSYCYSAEYLNLIRTTWNIKQNTNKFPNDFGWRMAVCFRIERDRKLVCCALQFCSICWNSKFTTIQLRSSMRFRERKITITTKKCKCCQCQDLKKQN